MHFLTRVMIKDFRSIADADVFLPGDVTPIVGLNGSGKSNFMRALNLFFNNAVEGGEPLRLRRDFREPGRQVKLRVVIEVDLDYAAFDALRSELEEALEVLADDSGEVRLRKEWTLDPVTREEVVALSAGTVDGGALDLVSTEELPFATRLLNAVRFRYVPNHVHPSEILIAEQESIRKVLQDRLGQRKVLDDEAIGKIAAVAADLMRPIKDAMQEATGEVADVELTTPKDWRDLAWAFGLKMRASQSRSFEALLHGSGVQSMLAFHVLHEIDTTFSGSFGWRKGAIWAVEEPESFLHASLQSELARAFVGYADSDSLQLIFSTHAAAFLGVASDGITVEIDSSGRSVFEVAERADVLRLAYFSGVAPYAHPLHTGPPQPVLLVEGENDRDLLIRAYVESGMPSPYEILCIEDFDDELTGGDDQIASWLNHNRPALLARPERSPVFVLLDWEASDGKVNKVTKVLEAHPSSKCFRWAKDLTNPDLSDSWVGIEKFLSTSFVEEMQDEIDLPLVVPARPDAETWQYDIKRARLKEKKAAIHRELDERADPDDIEPLIEALDWLTRQLSGAPPLL
jgi:predicted ATPase